MALPHDDLDAIASAAWARLVRGANDKRAAFNRPQLATLGAQGWPEQRTVVLRRVDPAERRLVIHTDRRSTKSGEIDADGRVSLLFWDPRALLQLRLWGQARLLTSDAIVEEEWTRLSELSRGIYRVPINPGRPITSPKDGDGQIAESGREVFAVISATVMRFEWLHLRKGGHRRARFDLSAAGWEGRWLAP